MKNGFRNGFIILFLALFLASPAFAVLTDSSLKVFAVAPDGKALAAELILHIAPGTGQVWSSVSGPLVGTATQSTEKIAVKMAKNYSSSVDDYDYFFTIQSNASVVDGPSAGSAMSLLVVSALQDKRVPTNVGLTGTITNTGEVGPVGGVFEKTKAANEADIDLFLIPRGESRQVVKLPEGVKNISIPEYALNEWDLKVVEVRNLDDVLRLAFTSIETIDINKQVEEEPETYIPPKIDVAKAAQPLGKLNTQFISQSREAISQAQQALSQTLLEDSGLLEVLSRTLSESEKTVNEAELLTENGYYYSAGNFSFLAKVNAFFVHDIAENPELVEDSQKTLDSLIAQLDTQIEDQQKILDQTVPIEGVEWYIAAQQRLTWAKLNLEKLKSQPQVIVVTENGEYNQSVERIQEYEFARAWVESVSQFYTIAREQSSKGLKSQTPFKDYYSQFIENAEKGLELISEGDSEDAQRRLDAAKMDQLNGRHLSAAMNAASSLSLINANLIETDTSKDIRLELENKINSLEEKMGSDETKYAWARLYLDHAKYYLNSATYYREQNQGTTAANNLSSGLTLAYLAENTFEVTKDVQEYYVGLPETAFSKLGNGNGNANGNNGGIIPISIGSDGKGSITVTGENESTFPLLPALLTIIVVFAVAYILVVRVPKHDSQALASSSNAMGNYSNSAPRELMAVDQLEARLFAAKTGMRHLQYQLAQGEMSNEKYAQRSKQYAEEIHSVRRELRGAERTLFKGKKINSAPMEEKMEIAPAKPTQKRKMPIKTKKWAVRTKK